MVSERLILAFRILVYCGAILRFILHRNDNSVFGFGCAIAAVGLLLAVAQGIHIFRQTQLRQAWTRGLVYLDILMISVLYCLTRTLESDFFLFYYLPIVTAAECLTVKDVNRAGILSAFGLAVSAIFLDATQEPGSSASGLVFSVLLPRGLFLTVVVVLSAHFKKAQLDRDALRSTLPQVVRAAGSASELDHNLESLLDCVTRIGFDCAAIALVDEYMASIRMVRARNVPPRQIRMSSFPLSSDDIMAQVVSSRAVRIFDAGAYDPSFSRPIYNAFNHVNLARVFMPLVHESPSGERKVIGSLECGRWKRGNDAKAANDFVREHAAEVQRLANEHAAPIGSNRTHEMLAEVARQAMELAGAHSASIHVYTNDEMVHQAGAGRATPEFLRCFRPRFPEGFGWEALQRREVIAADAKEIRSRHPALWANGVSAIAVFPILNIGGPKNFAVLYIHFWQGRRHIPRRSTEIAKLFVEQVGPVIQNYLSLRQFSETAERTWQVSLLQTLIQSLASEHLASVAQSRVLLEGIAKNTLLYLPDADRVTVYEYFVDHFCAPVIANGHDDRSLTVSTRDLSELYSVVAKIEASNNLSQYPENTDSENGEFRSSAQLLLKAHGVLVGILFIDYLSPHCFEEHERKAINSFASTAAVAVSTARLLREERKQRDEIAILQQTIRDLSESFRLEDVGNSILEQLRKVVPYSSASVQLVRDDTRVILAGDGFAVHRADSYLLRPPSKDSFIAGVVGRRDPTVIPDTSSQDFQTTEKVGSWIGLPLWFRDELVALITIDHWEHGYFASTSPTTLRSFAEQAAITLYKALQFKDAERRIRNLDLVGRAHDAIDCRMHVDEAIDFIVRLISDGMECDVCTIFLKERVLDDAVLRARAAHGELSEKTRARSYALSQCEGSMSPVIAAFVRGRQLTANANSSDSGPRDLLEKRKTPRAMITAPIATGGHKLGVVVAERNVEGFFTESDALTVEAIAHSIGIAVQRERGFALIREVGERILRATRVDEVFKQIVTGVVSIMDLDAGVIYLSGPGHSPPEPVFSFPPGAQLPSPREDGLTEYILKEGRSVWIEKTFEFPLLRPELSNDYESLVGIPLATGDHVEGVLFVFSKHQRQYTESERSLLQSFANQATLVVQKTRHLQRAVKRLEDNEQRKPLTDCLSARRLGAAMLRA